MGFISELWDFMKVRKKFWLVTIIVVFLLFGAFIIFTETSVIAPLIYTVF